MAFIDKEALEYKLFLEETSKNKVLSINVRKYTTKNNLNYNDYWEKVIYPIDRLRMETNEFNLFDYILNNIDTLSKEDNLDKSILDTLTNINMKTSIPNIKFKLVSTNGIENIKNMIDLALNISNTKDILDIMIETPPNYYVTSTKTTDISNHQKFITALDNLSKNVENNIYFNSQ
jgi:translation initiation factor 2 alpha subunit (eIF-2alpha)